MIAALRMAWGCHHQAALTVTSGNRDNYIIKRDIFCPIYHNHHHYHHHQQIPRWASSPKRLEEWARCFEAEETDADHVDDDKLCAKKNIKCPAG